MCMNMVHNNNMKKAHVKPSSTLQILASRPSKTLFAKWFVAVNLIGCPLRSIFSSCVLPIFSCICSLNLSSKLYICGFNVKSAFCIRSICNPFTALRNLISVAYKWLPAFYWSLIIWHHSNVGTAMVLYILALLSIRVSNLKIRFVTQLTNQTY